MRELYVPYMRRLSLLAGVFAVVFCLLVQPIPRNVDVFILDSNNVCLADDYQVTVVIEEARIIEDRDFGDSEIYLKVEIDSGSAAYSSIYTGINDGDTINLDWTVLNDVRASFTIRIEVWESDDGYNEGSNDYLGHIEYNRDPATTTEGWHDAAGRIGGNYDLQAQVYISETAEDVTGPEISSPTDVEYAESETGNMISWTATDENPDDYTITKDDTQVASNTWGSGSPIIVNVDSLSAGTYVYVITVRDVNDNSASDTVLVTVTGSIFSPPAAGDTSGISMDVMVVGVIAIVGLVGVVSVLAILSKKFRFTSTDTQPSSPMVLIICPYCGAKTEQGITKCQNCGAEL